MEWKRAAARLQKVFVSPLSEELPFYILFLLAISVMPIRFIPSHIHALYMERLFNFFFIDFPRAGAISYLFTLIVYYSRCRVFKVLGYIIASVLFTVCLFLHLVFHKTLQPDIITLVAETNTRESTEFLSSFLFSKGGGLTLLLLAIYLFLIVFLEKRKRKVSETLNELRHKVTVGVMLVLFILDGFAQFRFYHTILAVNTVDDIPEDYGCFDSVTTLFYSLYSVHLVEQEMQRAVKATCEVKQAPISSESDSLNVVYVIGESYIKCHSQLYGYYLPTTPHLVQEEKKGNLFVFDHVVSPFNQTSLTMKNTFCCNSLRNGEKWSDYPYFPAIFKKAGFQVYFWDIQKDDGMQALFEFSLNSFVYNKDLMRESYTQVSKNSFRYDNQAVQDFRKEAKGMGKYNLVMFHLMGQHVMAESRYPHTQQFDIFSFRDIKSNKPYLNDQKKQMIAEYDNATRYNDYVVKHIIDMFRDKNTVILYFSDHGEEIYDYRDSYGRVDFDAKTAKIGYRYQYEVPFMIWCSDKYQQRYPRIVDDVKKALHRPFRTDEICQVLFHIAQLHTSYYRAKYDVLSTDYEPLRTESIQE